MRKLSPCENALVLPLLLGACPAPRALLDAGCGPGGRLGALRGALPAARLSGIDCDAESVNAARAACPDAEIVTGDVCALPWPDGTFDAAFCECTLSLLGTPERCLAELSRVLRPGGVLLLSDLCTEEPTPARVCIAPEGAVRYLASRRWTEAAAAAAGFTLKRFRDCREEYLTMAAQMILDGSDCCLAPGAFAALRRHKAGYGLWIYERRDAP
jgi:ubiquinone/menaquinone biosynthesis C-methylase UbiE